MSDGSGEFLDLIFKDGGSSEVIKERTIGVINGEEREYWQKPETQKQWRNTHERHLVEAKLAEYRQERLERSAKIFDQFMLLYEYEPLLPKEPIAKNDNERKWLNLLPKYLKGEYDHNSAKVLKDFQLQQLFRKAIEEGFKRFATVKITQTHEAVLKKLETEGVDPGWLIRDVNKIDLSRFNGVEFAIEVINQLKQWVPKMRQLFDTHWHLQYGHGIDTNGLVEPALRKYVDHGENMAQWYVDGVSGLKHTLDFGRSPESDWNYQQLNDAHRFLNEVYQDGWTFLHGSSPEKYKK